jgi:hypothetical protein
VACCEHDFWRPETFLTPLNPSQSLKSYGRCAGAGSSQGLLGDGDDGGMFEWVYGHYKRRLQEANGVDFNGFIRCGQSALVRDFEAISRPLSPIPRSWIQRMSIKDEIKTLKLLIIIE